MYAVDLKSGIQLPLCGKVDCSHTGGRCNAYLFEGKKNESVFIHHIQPYENVIMVFYVVISSGKYTYRLVGISPDGSTRYDYIDFEILRPDGVEEEESYAFSVYDIRVEDGYIYFLERWGFNTDPDSSESGEYTYRLWRISLSDGKSRCLYEKKRPSVTKLTYDTDDGDIYVMFGTYIVEDLKVKNDIVEVAFIDGKSLEKSEPAGERKYGCFMTEGGYPVGSCVKRNNSGKFLIINQEYDIQNEESSVEYVLYDRVTGKEIVKTDVELWNLHLRRSREYLNFIDEHYIYLNDDSGVTYIYDLDFNPVYHTSLGVSASFGEYFQLGTDTIVKMEEVKAGKEVYYSFGSYDYNYDIYTPNTFVYSKPLTAKKEETNP